jgi:adenylosuccinate synthase
VLCNVGEDVLLVCVWSFFVFIFFIVSFLFHFCFADVPIIVSHPFHSTDIGRHLQEVGAEIGVTTGRKRRCGWLDVPVVQYGHMINNYQSINLTKLDVMDDLDEVKIGVAYKINGTRLLPGQMPSTLEDLYQVEVEYETMPGWRESIENCTDFDSLPDNAKAYVHRIEELVGCHISWIGTGPKREAMVTNGFEL